MQSQEQSPRTDEAIAQCVGLFLGHAQNLGGLGGYQDLHGPFAAKLDFVSLRGVDEVENGFFRLRRVELKLLEKTQDLRVVLLEQAEQHELGVELVLPQVDELHRADVYGLDDTFGAVSKQNVVHGFHDRSAAVQV